MVRAHGSTEVVAGRDYDFQRMRKRSRFFQSLVIMEIKDGKGFSFAPAVTFLFSARRKNSRLAADVLILQNIAARHPSFSGHVWFRPSDEGLQLILAVHLKYCLAQNFYPPWHFL
jgi:hypothetical protein